MSRKDFQLIADVLRKEAEGWPIDHPLQSEFANLRLAFAEALRGTNERFDTSRFLDAARPDPDAYNAHIRELRGNR